VGLNQSRHLADKGGQFFAIFVRTSFTDFPLCIKQKASHLLITDATPLSIIIM